MTDAPALRLVDVVVRRGDTDLGPASVEVGTGEAVALVGPNGAGKTTLIRIALGLLHCDQGYVEIHGQPVSPRSPPLGVGYVPDRDELFAFASARANLAPFAVDASAVGVALASVGLAAVADIKVARYSRGMRQRLLLARALIRGPQLLVFDEPTIALDREAAAHLTEAFAAHVASGGSVLVSTHDPAFVERIDARVTYLEPGMRIAG